MNYKNSTPDRCDRDKLGRSDCPMWASRAEQRTTDPFPPSGRPLTCDDARSANGLLRASAQVAGSSSCVAITLRYASLTARYTSPTVTLNALPDALVSVGGGR